ncbi:hypothetical protein GGR44_001425 [Sphingobium fontiphilum]|uniref:Uncharacterized protein n=2 Tax=Sphingobium fontiphilum TaxID=944425 RepID=A0A7W6GMZ2_9SPHN|nr:hypothetical protein [Sphingobium fontiphilum]
MAINLNYPKTSEIKKPNGIFIVFNDYEKDDDFQDFINFVVSKLDVDSPESVQFPYSQAAVIDLPGGEITAMFHDDTGCCVRVAPDEQALADLVVRACYGEPSG